MNQTSPNNQSQISVIFAILRFLIESIFPSLLLIKAHGIVSKASWAKNPWFKQQKAQCVKVALLLLVPSGISLYAAKATLDEFQIMPKLVKAQNLAKAKQAKKFLAELTTIPSQIPLKETGKSLAVIFAVPFLLSLYIRTQNEILVKTRRLQKILKENGFWREGKTGLAVYTPIGIVLDVTGRNPKDIIHDTSIWYALNIAIEERDWEEKPGQRSIVMFKNAFVLQSEYIYK